MRPISILAAGTLAFALAAPAIAAPEGKPGRGAPIARAEMMAKVDQRFDRIDTNRDGSIDKAEMTAHREAMRAARAERLAAMSAEDRARVEERRAVLKERMAKRAEGTEAAREGGVKRGWLARIDINGDGAISKEEFAARAMKRFERLDADRDGIVTPDERKAARRTARG